METNNQDDTVQFDFIIDERALDNLQLATRQKNLTAAFIAKWVETKQEVTQGEESENETEAA